MTRHLIVASCALGVLLMHLQIALASPDFSRIDGSASIPQTKKYSYEAANMLDRKSTTAWCTREHRHGKAWIELSARTPSVWTGLGLVNGYARSEQSFKGNSRVKKIGVYADGKFVREFAVADTAMPQWLAFGPVHADSLKLVVDETYKGERDDDLCITELILDSKVISVWTKLDKIARHVGNRSLNSAEIGKLYQPLLRDAHAGEAAQNSFLHAVALYTSGQNEVELRMLLDLIYEADQERDVDVELLEAATSLIVQYFKYSPRVVTNVLRDKNQLMRERLAYAYTMFVASFNDEDLEKYRQGNEDFRQLSLLIEKSQETQ